jgi:hypothetical protein
MRRLPLFGCRGYRRANKELAEIETALGPGGDCRGTIGRERNVLASRHHNWEVPMNWPVILSGVVSLAALALGFDLLLPLGSGLEPVCVLTGVASAMVFFGLVEGA